MFQKETFYLPSEGFFFYDIIRKTGKGIYGYQLILSGAFLDPVIAMSCWTFWRRKKRRSAGCLQSLDWGNAPGDLRINYEIRDLHQVLELV